MTTLEERVNRLLSQYDRNTAEVVNDTIDVVNAISIDDVISGGQYLSVTPNELFVLDKTHAVLNNICERAGLNCEECPLFDSDCQCGVHKSPKQYEWLKTKLRVVKNVNE